MAETPSKTRILLARMVIVLLTAFTAVGVFWYGLWRRFATASGSN